MRNYNNFLCYFCLALFLGMYSCSSDDGQDISEVQKEQPEIPEPEGNIPDPQPEEGAGIMGTVEFLNSELVDDNYILVNDAEANRAYIMDKQARLVHEWELTNNIGNDVFLLPDGRVLASLESDDPKINLGGKGGQLQFIGPDNTVEWKFLYSSELAETHHDAELLPNGNVIALVWEKRTAQEASDGGSMVSTDIYPEAIIEIDPNTDEIVWEWHSWDHLIQDYDDSKSNFGVVGDHPELIDLNYVPKNEEWPELSGDIMHANAIAYDPVNDLIFISANFFSEVWVIDHRTTKEEAASHSGGAYGKGGDLVYRFGNPKTYHNPAGTRRFYNNHFPNLLKGADQGKLLIFSNGKGLNQSTVYELQLPDQLELIPYADNEPEVLWSFTDPELYSGKVSGAVPLQNGNILITEGDYGFWEVTREQEVVWKFSAPGFFWRGYAFDREATEIQALGL